MNSTEPCDDEPMADLIASGVVLPPTVESPMPMPAVVAPADADGGKLLSEQRAQERW